MQWINRIRQVKILLVVAAVLLSVASLVVSHFLVRDLKREELLKMNLWAEAMRSLNEKPDSVDVSLEFAVMNGNNTIPVVPFLTKANAKLLPKCHSHQIFNHYYSDFHLVWGCGRVIPTKKVGRSLRATAPPCVKHSTCAPHHMVSTMLCSSAMRRMFKMA